MDTFVRLTKSPVVSLARIRGCVRGVSSEFVLACDMRFASRENTKLGHPELGVGLHPGGGGTERLPHLVGRGRALEIVLSANDFDGDTAERYGYVNRSLPDAELDGFVDALARRIALLRSARSRSGEESRQPGLVAAVRSAPGRLHFVWDSTDVARSPAPHRSRAGTRAAT